MAEALPVHDLSRRRKEKELWRLAREIDALLGRMDSPSGEALQLLSERCARASSLLKEMAAEQELAPQLQEFGIRLPAELSAWDD